MYICHMHVSIHRGHMTVLDSWDLELQKEDGYPVRVLRTELRFSKRVANTFKLWAICSAILFDSLTTAILSVLRWKESQCNFNLLFLMTNNIAYYFKCLLSIFMSSFRELCSESWSFKNFGCYFFDFYFGIFVYCLFASFWLLYIISINILLIIKLGNIFSTFVIMWDPFLFS